MALRHASVVLVIGLATLLNACASQGLMRQDVPTTQVSGVNLQPDDFRTGGIVFITPSSITGQEEDKQALALAFTAVLLKARPDLRIGNSTA